MEPTSLLNGPDIALGITEIGGVPVEYRAYDNNEALKMLVAVLPEQKVAIVQDLLFTMGYISPLVWIGKIGLKRLKPCVMIPLLTRFWLVMVCLQHGVN